MERLTQLRKLMGENLPLKSTRRRGSNGVSYTDRELSCARFVARLVLTAGSVEISEPIKEEELESDSDKALIFDIFQQLIEQKFTDLTQAIRRTYKAFEDVVLTVDDSYEDFPVTDQNGRRLNRNQSSLTVMLRQAIRDLVPKEVVDQMFKLYQSNKKNPSR